MPRDLLNRSVTNRVYFANRYANPAYKATRSAACKARLDKFRNAAYALLGEVCAECGFTDRRALQIDHKYGDGYLERKTGSSDAKYRRVLANPDRYQILCANHNWIKRFENGEVRKV